MAGIDGVSALRLVRSVGAQLAHRFARRRVEQMILGLVHGGRLICHHRDDGQEGARRERDQVQGGGCFHWVWFLESVSTVAKERASVVSLTGREWRDWVF